MYAIPVKSEIQTFLYQTIIPLPLPPFMPAFWVLPQKGEGMLLMFSLCPL